MHIYLMRVIICDTFEESGVTNCECCEDSHVLINPQDLFRIRAVSLASSVCAGGLQGNDGAHCVHGGGQDQHRQEPLGGRAGGNITGSMLQPLSPNCVCVG